MLGGVSRLRVALTLALVAIGVLSLRAGSATAISGGYAPHPSVAAWVTAIVDPTVPGASDFDRRVCAGVLIAPDRVLTAAHCVVDFAPDGTVTPRPPSRFQALVGRRSLIDSSQGVRRNVTGVALHPRLSLPQSGVHQYHAFYDIAVLFLDSPVSIPAAPIGTATTWGTSGTVLGWGHVNNDHLNPVYEPDLKAADFQLLTDSQCASWWNDQNQHYDPAIHVCINNPPNQPVSCITHGDSGGPLMVQAGGVWTLIGITSFFPHTPDRCNVGGPFGFAWVAGPELRSWPLTVANSGPGPAAGGGPPAPLDLTVTRLQVQRYSLAMIRAKTNGRISRFSKTCSPTARKGFTCRLRWRIARRAFAGTAAFWHVERDGKLVTARRFTGTRRVVGCRTCRVARLRW
jgi:Trypsin